MIEAPTKQRILDELRLFSLGTGGIGSWITETTGDVVFERLNRIQSDPLTKVQLNQLLVLGHESPLSDGFFKYYWLEVPVAHTYDCATIADFDAKWLGGEPLPAKRAYL